MESTESYAAGSPEELAKRSPEPHDSSEAGIFDPIWSFVFFPSLHFPFDFDSNVSVFRHIRELDLV